VDNAAAAAEAVAAAHDAVGRELHSLNGHCNLLKLALGSIDSLVQLARMSLILHVVRLFDLEGRLGPATRK
jgi:hypothetical protein